MHRTRPHNGTGSAAPPARGFSLVELTLVLAMVGVLAALAAPRFANATSSRSVEAAAARLTADLRYAQASARATSADCTVAFDRDAGYSIVVPGKPTTIIDLAAEPYGVTLVAKLVGDSTTLIYNGFGSLNSEATLTISRGGHSATLIVDAQTGEVRRQ